MAWKMSLRLARALLKSAAWARRSSNEAVAPGSVNQNPLQKASEGGRGIAEPKKYHFKLAQTLAKRVLGSASSANSFNQ